MRLHTRHLLPLLALAAACGGDGASGGGAETTAAAGVTAAPVGDTAFGGDTALSTGASTATAIAQQGATAPPLTGSVGEPATASSAAPTPGSPEAPPPAALGATAKTAPASPAATASAAGAASSPGLPASAGATSTATPAAQEPATGAATSAAAAAPATRTGRAAVPFGINERLEYDVKFGALDVGDAAMQLNGVETIRGREAYHTVFRVSGGTLFFKVNDRYESWIDTRTLSSHRHVQQIDEGSYERERVYEIFHDRGVYRENQKPEQKTVDEPLDDGSFFYFVRTIPLEVGKTYTFDRYFKPDRNPVTIKVLRKEKVRVPAGTYDAVVIQPIIKTKGIFGEGGRAEIWLADDSTRAMLQMKSQLKFGSLNLYLKKYRAGQKP